MDNLNVLKSVIFFFYKFWVKFRLPATRICIFSIPFLVNECDLTKILSRVVKLPLKFFNHVTSIPEFPILTNRLFIFIFEFPLQVFELLESFSQVFHEVHGLI